MRLPPLAFNYRLAALLLGLGAGVLPAAACPVCRPRVQATIHAPDYAQNLLLLVLPVALLLLLGGVLFFAGPLTRRFTSALSTAPHG